MSAHGLRRGATRVPAGTGSPLKLAGFDFGTRRQNSTSQPRTEPPRKPPVSLAYTWKTLSTLADRGRRERPMRRGESISLALPTFAR